MKPRFSDDGHVIYLDYDVPGGFLAWVTTITALVQDARYVSAKALIIDRTGVTPPSADLVRAVAQYHGSHPETFRGFRVALVVSDPATFGLGRMGQMLLDDQGIVFDIFQDLEAAESWARGRSVSDGVRARA